MSSKGGLKAEFDKKITENILENNEEVTNETYMSYQEIENRIINDISSRYDAKDEVHRDFHVGSGKRIDIYAVKPGGINEIYEIKVVRSSSLVKDIAENAIRQLKSYAAQLPGEPDMHLIIASHDEINLKELRLPKDIKVEIFQL